MRSAIRLSALWDWADPPARITDRIGNPLLRFSAVLACRLVLLAGLLGFLAMALAETVIAWGKALGF